MENFKRYLKKNEPFPHLVIESSFNEYDQNLIWKELEFINLNDRLSSNSKNNLFENKNLVPIRDIFIDTRFSDISKLTSLFLDEELKKNFSELNFGYNSIWNTYSHSTFLSYYGENDFYEYANNSSLYTILSFFYKKPKNFSGGELIFNDFNFKISIKNNTTIIFPSFVSYSINKIILNETMKGCGQYCISTLLMS